jgi:predicted SAM-dependent methyltransferase
MDRTKLHIGCGWRNWPGWINIDGGDYPNIHYKDVTKLEFENESVDLIYTSHLIAYFDRQEIIPIIKEWKRVLKPNGVLRIATPDFETISKLCLEGAPLESFLGPLYGKMPLGTETVYHKTTYNFESLKKLLIEIGFSVVQKYDFKELGNADFDDHSRAHYPHDPNAIETGNYTGTLISLNVEAIK